MNDSWIYIRAYRIKSFFSSLLLSIWAIHTQIYSFIVNGLGEIYCIYKRNIACLPVGFSFILFFFQLLSLFCNKCEKENSLNNREKKNLITINKNPEMQKISDICFFFFSLFGKCTAGMCYAGMLEKPENLLTDNNNVRKYLWRYKFAAL